VAIQGGIVLPALDHHEAVRLVAGDVQVVLQATRFGATGRDNLIQGLANLGAELGFGGNGGDDAE